MDDATLSAGADGRQGGGGNLGPIVAKLEPMLGQLGGEPVALEGGITNRNFKATFGRTEYVIRVPGKDTGALGIDRNAERVANQRAAEAGIAPPVAAALADPPCLVTEFVEGSPLSAAQLRDPERIREVAWALETLHDSGDVFPTSFDTLAIVEAYAAEAERRGAEIPASYEPAHRCAERISAALDGEDHEAVPCHNDLLAANFIHDGERLRIVDWEYAGMGDRYFDLANFAVNNEFGEAETGLLLEAYFGAAPGEHERAALGLMRFMSDFREAMWGVVQSAVSDIDFDFSGYADRHFTRMAQTSGSGGFDGMLEAAGA